MSSTVSAGKRSTAPCYAAELACFHQAFADDLGNIVKSLPLKPDAKVLDIACGDGFYTLLLAERLSSQGHVVGVDVNRDFLHIARGRINSTAFAARVEFVEASIEDLPFPEASFDYVWCAQSLYSLPDPTAALGGMRRALRPGGGIGVLENDTLHQILLPWPGPLEIALRAAQYTAMSLGSSRPERFYVGRRLPSALAAAGFSPTTYRTQCIDRCGQIDAALEDFVIAYLERLAESVRPILPAALRDEFERLISPASSDYLIRQPYFTMSWLNVLACGRRSIDA